MYIEVMIRAVIFDFYGVLYTNFDWQAIDERIQSDEGKAQRFAHLKNQSNKGLLNNVDFRREVAKLADDKNHPDNPAVLAEPDINRDLVEMTKEIIPNVKIALLSNGNRPDVVSQLRECAIYPAFDEVFTSSDMHFIKPEKAAYLHAFRQLGVEPEEAVIVDDSPGHTGATESYGFNAIHFTDNRRYVDELKELTA